VDFGTAVTFDAVSRKGEYLGGMIMPGLRISIDALADRTALLPQITLRRPKEFIGKDTQSSILSGIVYGFAAITDVLAHRIKDKIGRNALVIGTGGNINLIGRYCKNIDTIDQDLTLKGINLIYRKIKCLK
jgi:type III pantothenate kinase